MSEFSTPLPSGLRVRHIQTQLVNGKAAPVLDGAGQEIELWAVDVPQHIEAVDGTKQERQAVIEGFVADIQTKGPDLALVRADAVIAKQDPAAAETAFVAAQAGVGVVVGQVTVQPGGKV
jgi:hypothetical protein